MEKHIISGSSMEINFDDVFGGPPRFVGLMFASRSVATSSAVLDKGTGRTPSFRNSSLPTFELPVFGDDTSSRSIFSDSRTNSNVHGVVSNESGPSTDSGMISSSHFGSRSKASSRSSSRRMSPVHPAISSTGQAGTDDRATNKIRPAVGRLSKQGHVLSAVSFDESKQKTRESLLLGSANESCQSNVSSSSPQLGSFGHQRRSTGVIDGIDIATLQLFVDSDDAFGGYFPQSSYGHLNLGVPHTLDSCAQPISGSNKPGLKSLSSASAFGSPDSVDMAFTRSSSTKQGREHRDKQLSSASQIDLSGPKRSEPNEGTTSPVSHDGVGACQPSMEDPEPSSIGAPLKYKSWKDLLTEPPLGTSFTSKKPGLVVPPANEISMDNDTPNDFTEKPTRLRAHHEVTDHLAEMEEKEMQALLSTAWKYNEQVERENYNTKFPVQTGKNSARQVSISHCKEYEPGHVQEKDSEVNWKERSAFAGEEILIDESSVGGLPVDSKMHADKLTGKGNRENEASIFEIAPDGIVGLHSENGLKRSNENLTKELLQGRSDGLRKNASFHGFASSLVQETSYITEQSRSQSATRMDMDFVLASASGFNEVEGESFEHRKLRWDRYVQSRKRVEKALEEMQQRDAELQRQEDEMQQFYDTSDEKFKRWAVGKEENLRALLSNLQHVLWSDSSWNPIPLSDLIEVPDVKKAYRKATLFVHPDKMQQKGATVQQKYIAEKVFDLLQAAWKSFNLQESF